MIYDRSFAKLILDLKLSSKVFYRALRAGTWSSQHSDSGNRLGRKFHRKVAFFEAGYATGIFHQREIIEDLRVDVITVCRIHETLLQASHLLSACMFFLLRFAQRVTDGDSDFEMSLTS